MSKLKTSEVVKWISTLGFMLIIYSTVGCESAKYSNERLDMVKKSTEIFVKNGLCNNLSSCQKEEIILSGGMAGGFYVYIYGNVDLKTVGEISSIYLEKYIESKRKISISLTFFSVSHKEDMARHFWERDNVYLTINLKGDK